MVGFLNKALVADAQQVLEVVQSGSAQICDARAAARFRGEVAEPRPGLVSGCIPGSLNLPHDQLTLPDDQSTFRSIEELREIVADSGLVPGARAITTCGSGLTAAKITLALYLLGWPLQSAPVYDGSWSEWGQVSRPDLPKVEKSKD